MSERIIKIHDRFNFHDKDKISVKRGRVKIFEIIWSHPIDHLKGIKTRFNL